MDKDDIVNDLNDHYSKTTLLNLAKFVGLNVTDSLNKFDLIEQLVDHFYHINNLQLLFNNISREAEIVLKHLVWFGISTLRHIEALYHIKVSLDDFYGNTDDSFIKMFKVYHIKDIQLSTGLRNLFKRHVKMPPKGEIKIGSINVAECKVLSAKYSVVDQLEAIFDFISEENIKDRGVDKKLLLTTKRAFKKKFNFDEPFLHLNNSNKHVDTIGSDVLLKFLASIESQDRPLKTLSLLLKKYKNGQLEDLNIDSLLFYPYIRGLNKNYNINIFLKRGRFSIINKIQSFQTKEWIDIESLVSNLSFNEDTHIFDTSYFGSLLSVKFDTEVKLLFKEDNELYLISPLTKGIILLFHTLGLVDIAIKENKSFTPFDNIISFRLTELGLKLFGHNSSYVENTNYKTSYILHKSRRLITLSDPNPRLENFLNRVGEDLGDRNYYITFSSFLKKCNSIEDVEYNINQFKKQFSSHFSKVWSDFFTQLEDRINPIYNEQELLVINFPKDNSQFIDIVLNDAKIRNLFIMVEGCRGAFSRNDFISFKKLMKEYGFYI